MHHIQKELQSVEWHHWHVLSLFCCAGSRAAATMMHSQPRRQSWHFFWCSEKNFWFRKKWFCSYQHFFFWNALIFPHIKKELWDGFCCCINKTRLTSVAEQRGESSDVLWPESQLVRTFWLSEWNEDKSSSECSSSEPNPPTPSTTLSYHNSHLSWRTKWFFFKAPNTWFSGPHRTTVIQWISSDWGASQAKSIVYPPNLTPPPAAPRKKWITFTIPANVHPFLPVKWTLEKWLILPWTQ